MVFPMASADQGAQRCPLSQLPRALSCSTLPYPCPRSEHWRAFWKCVIVPRWCKRHNRPRRSPRQPLAGRAGRASARVVESCLLSKAPGVWLQVYEGARMLQEDPPQTTGAVFVGLAEAAKLICTPQEQGIDGKSRSHGTTRTHLPAPQAEEAQLETTQRVLSFASRAFEKTGRGRVVRALKGCGDRQRGNRDAPVFLGCGPWRN